MWIRSAARVRHSWLVANIMVVAEGVASSEAILTQAWGFERGSGVKMTSRRGTEHNYFGCRRDLTIHEGGSGRWQRSEVRQMIIYWKGSGLMANLSIRSDGQRRGGCHCNRFLGAYQQEDNSKLIEEV